MPNLLLGIDLGTGSSKGVLTTPTGEVMAQATRHHDMSLPRPGWAEFDAEGVWWADVVALCQELLAQTSGAEVAAVCVSGVGPCLLLCEGDKPVRPAILYGIDLRATAEIEELTERFGHDAILRRCGKLLSTQAVGPKMLWASRHEPENFRRANRWYGSSSFAVSRLTGEYVMDHHTASQCDPLYDIRRSSWATDWATDVAEHLQMPRLAWPGETAGTVTEEAAAQTGLRRGTPVMTGTIDAWAEAWSAGVRNPGDLMVMYGSTMFMIHVPDVPRVHPLLWQTNGVEPGQQTMAAGMGTSGSLTAWVRRLTGDVPFDQLAYEAGQVPPGAEGLLVLPYFAGERTPVFDAKARGVIAGLTLRHGRGHLYRAAYEGVGYGVRQILEVMQDGGDYVRRAVAVGGGTTARLWTQIVSDVCGLEQEVPAQTIGASYGDALLAATGVGLVPPGTNWATVAERVIPDGSTHERYEEMFNLYAQLYPSTKHIVNELTP